MEYEKCGILKDVLTMTSDNTVSPKPLGIDDLISVMEIHNNTGRPVKNLCGRSEFEVLREVLDYLKAYRESGLWPYEIETLAKAKAEGRLITLPCKVGDTAYAIVGNGIIQCKVTEACIKENGISYLQMFSENDRIANYQYDHFCKTVFLTREAAEKALNGGDN